MNSPALPLMWANCVERLKDRINNRSFWEALEATRPLTIENDTLIIGLATGNFNLASHLTTTSRLHDTREVIKEVFGQDLQVRIIEGSTLDDWEQTKQKDARVAAMQQQTVSRQVREDTQPTSWEQMNEYLSRMFVATPYKGMPQGKARYANDALYVLAETMETIYGDYPDEQAERSLARTLDRIANAAEIPAPVLAFELERLRAWRKQNQPTYAEPE